MVLVAIYYSYNILFCTVFALYFFNDGIAHTATAQKGVRNSGDISVICSFLAYDDSDYSICSLPELRKCMNDAFCVTFGCFCMWSCFNELLHDLACLEEFLTILLKNRTCF